MHISKIVIAGAGTMGYSMAQIFAQFHFYVTLYDLKEEALSKAQDHIHDNIQYLVKNKEMTYQEAKNVNQYLSYTTNQNCFHDCDMVIENIIENIDIKKSFYKEISNIVKDDCILATNTSGISITALANAVSKPERFIGMHWFNPPHLIPLIEIIKGQQTSENITNIVYQLSIDIKKKPVVVNKDVLGFAANRIQFAVLREALYLVDQEVISIEDIDKVMKYGLGFRYACLGPLEIADFGGLDTFYHISEYLMKDLCDSHEVPTLLKELYDHNCFGVKNKQGFYDYKYGKDVKSIHNRDNKFLKVFKALYK